MYDLSKLYINFTTVPKGVKISSHFAELAPFREFTECDDTRIKIAILSADVDSPFVRIKDRETMMRSIFEELDIDLSKVQNQSFLQDCISYQDPKYLFAWVKYLNILHETDFTNWNLAKKDYDFYLFKANERQGDTESDLQYMKRRKESREQVKTLGDEVKSIEAKIFPDSKAAREAAVAEARKKIELYAESYAEPYSYY